MKKEEFVTKKYLDKTLDKRLAQHAQVIVSAVDQILEKRLKKVDFEFKEVRTDISGLNKRMEQMEQRLEKKIDNVQTLIDGYVKAQEDFKQEFVIMKEEMRQVKKVLKQKLGIEISAM